MYSPEQKLYLPLAVFISAPSLTKAKRHRIRFSNHHPTLDRDSIKLPCLAIALLSLYNSYPPSTGIPGDGRCLFRSVVHGACLRAGQSSPSESRERELADELRLKVAEEFIKRRVDTEWFLEGDFDTYVSQMRQPHVWGGEPELIMSSHVRRVPITVYMRDKKTSCLKTIAEYGQEYGKEGPIRVLYHGYGHYDALQEQGPSVGPQPKLKKKR
ncbi:unnamed protein product [Ilex paraguariensis]|uniref:Ubiquitin thioesterase OTU n=1 Tax=Ilex paraguariensis TaxID=185542 RepID=A0ABC8SF39_9AQUA